MPPVSTFRSFSRSCLALAISQAIIAPAHSANFVVNRSDDVVASDGSLSLREAIICARIGSVCTGALILARTGLLDGKKATTHWAYAQKLATVSDDIDVDTKAIFIRNNNIYTSAGVTSGMDMALAMVEEDWGSEASLAVAQELVLYLKRPGGQSQFSRYLNSQQPANNKLKELQLWILENLDKDLNVNFLADRTGMSPRSFARHFKKEIGLPPARYVEKIRVEQARRHLEESYLDIKTVAHKVGYNSEQSLRRSFIKQLGISPKAYQQRFGERQQVLVEKN